MSAANMIADLDRIAPPCQSWKPEPMLVELMVTFPRKSERKCVRVLVPEELYEEAFAPMPADRELSFALDSRARARRMERLRRQFTEAISQDLAAKLMEIVEARDPVKGYSPEQRAQMGAV